MLDLLTDLARVLRVGLRSSEGDESGPTRQATATDVYQDSLSLGEPVHQDGAVSVEPPVCVWKRSRQL